MKNVITTRIKIIVILLISTIVIALVGVTKAYFVEHSEKNNAFTVGNVDIKLTEERYNEIENVEKRKKIAPNEKIVKDPKISNIGTSDCFVFIEFTMPITFNPLVGQDGQFVSPDPIFDIVANEAFNYTADKNWVLVKTEKVPLNLPATLPDGTIIPETFETKYVYAYATGTANTGQMIALKKGETTTCIFADEVIQYGSFYDYGFAHRFDDPIWRELFRDNFKIPVKAYGIQAIESNFTNTDPLTVYNTLTAQTKATGGI